LRSLQLWRLCRTVQQCQRDEAFAPYQKMVRTGCTRKKIVEEQLEKNIITLEDRSTITEQMNVVVQIEHLMQYPYIRKAVKEGKLTVMGWWYHIDEGEIYDYDFKLKRFIRVE
jgi:carbonic anhydrase